jgi:small subunit ribosomal protein S6e
MVQFKLCIGTKSGKSYQKEVKDSEAAGFIGMNVGEKISGDAFGMQGYELLITGGSDYCGFPMRHGILGVRKKIYSYGGVGFPKLKKGEKTRKTVCGHKIHDKITQINLKVLKEGAKKIEEVMPAGEKKEEAPKEAKKEEKPKAEEKKVEEKPKKEPKVEEKKAEEQRIKDSPTSKSKDFEEKPKEAPKAEEKKVEEKPKVEEKKEEAPKEEKPAEKKPEEKKQ